MINICIIGAGQLGSRHLQALSLIDRKVFIQMVDPNEASLEIARKRFLEMKNNNNVKSLKYLTSIEALPNEIDLVIVATTADVRYSVLKTLLEKRQVRYLILEKILFQKVEDYSNIGKLIISKGIPAWVNCPRRIWPLYQHIKNKFVDVNQIEYSVSGSNWGLASNAIHFIDCFSFITGENNLDLTSEYLDAKIMNSNRPGFIEFTGSLLGKSERGSFISLKSDKEGVDPLVIKISSKTINCTVNETEQKAWISMSSNDWKLDELSFSIPYQSQMTHLVVKKILDTGLCELTAYEESSKLHIQYIECLIKHLEKLQFEDVTKCAIT
ncbi:MAG: Gfo/Idh/MocA family oxidoreductase [Bacillota bacterium]